MNHIPLEQWIAYVNNELDADWETKYEKHLYQCDTCLQHYMEAIETVEMTEPKLTTDTILKHMNKEFNIETELIDDKSQTHKKTLLHYTVAAAMTFVLMTSGVFSQFTHIIKDIEANETEKSSIVSALLNSPFSIIDNFKERE